MVALSVGGFPTRTACRIDGALGHHARTPAAQAQGRLTVGLSCCLCFLAGGGHPCLQRWLGWPESNTEGMPWCACMNIEAWAWVLPGS